MLTIRSPRALPSQNGRSDADPAIPLLIWGRRLDRRYLCYVRGQPVALTGQSFRALIDLALARATTCSGIANIPRDTIYRLRKELDRVLGPGSDEELIKSAGGEEYRLGIPDKQVKVQVALSPCFFELVAAKMLNEKEAKIIRKVCHILGKRQAAKLWLDD